MANLAFSGLPVATAAALTDIFAVTQSAATKQCTNAKLLALFDPVVPANETVARAVVLTDDNQTIPVNSAATTAYTMAASLGMLRGVRFLQLGTGSITLTVGATVTVNGVLGSVTPTLTLTTTQYTGASLIKLAAADTYVLM